MRIFLLLGAIFGGLSVAGGAFASHALKAQLSPRSLEIFETGARYQMYHALALLAVAVLSQQLNQSATVLNVAGAAFTAGIFLFSGSLYALSLSGVGWLGAIAPIGGAAFLVGWGCIAIAALS
ncbi:MAG: DUF423 domain-containing protein [Cyanobacteria bacterium P01_F01_bin.42]